MAYLVVLVVDNPPHEAGDVISWRPEGSESFGIKMLEHDWFRVIHAPDMTDAEADALTAQQLGDRMVNPHLKLRAQKLDLTGLPNIPNKPLAEKWDGAKYLVPHDITIPKALLTRALQMKAIVNPNVIGEEPVIG